jgi:hypothetical protein
MPLSKTPLVKFLFYPLDRHATLAMTATPVIASAAKQSSQSNNRRSRRGNPDAFIRQGSFTKCSLVHWIAALRSQ